MIVDFHCLTFGIECWCLLSVWVFRLFCCCCCWHRCHSMFSCLLLSKNRFLQNFISVLSKQIFCLFSVWSCDWCQLSIYLFSSINFSQVLTFGNFKTDEEKLRFLFSDKIVSTSSNRNACKILNTILCCYFELFCCSNDDSNRRLLRNFCNSWDTFAVQSVSLIEMWNNWWSSFPRWRSEILRRLNVNCYYFHFANGAFGISRC